MRRITLFLAFCWLLGAVCASAAEVPQLINFQGRLTDAAGQTVPDNSYTVTFRLFDNLIGGSLLWEEDQSITTAGGLFTVLLGASLPIPDAAFDVDNCYLEVQPSGSDPIAPRARLTSVAYARNAGLLDGASAADLDESGEITAHAAQPSAHHSKTMSASELVTGTLAEELLPQRGIDSTEIQDASISARQILDEAGIAHSHSTLTTISSTLKIIDSSMIVAPSFGYVLVMASGWFYDLHSTGGQVSTTLSLSSSRTSHDLEHTARFEVRTNAPAGHTTENFMIQSVHVVNQGQMFKLFLLGSMVGSEFPNVQNVHLNSLFFPTSYGEIDVPLAP
jgi:hypothetical protein